MNSPFRCSKIGKLTLARLLMAREQLMSYNATNAGDHYGEALQLYKDLMELDPPHIQYYKDEYSSVLLRQVIFLSLLLTT